MQPRHRSHPNPGGGRARYPGSFMLAVREAIAGLGWKIGGLRGDTIECTDAKGREQLIGLENLYRRARRIERADWPSLIAEFLETSQQSPIDDPPKDLEGVADKLLFRLGPPMAVRGKAPEVWQKAIDETGLVISLVVDFPKSMFYVTAEMVANSGKPGEEWFNRALTNLQAKTALENFKAVHEESGLLQCGVGDAYDASRILLLDSLLPEHRQHGFFVTLPGRDEVLILPVSSQALAFLPMLKMAAAGNHRKTPYPISDEVYWIRDGHWRVFPIHVRDNQAHVQPPEEFLPVLKELMPEAQEQSDGEEKSEEGD